MNTDHYLIIDIETRPLPLDVLKERGLFPRFEPPANYKDPKKIKAAEEAHEAKCMEKAALDPIISEVCAIGMLQANSDPRTVITDEASMIQTLWQCCSDITNDLGVIIGFRIKTFDLPYCFRRSWALGIKPPKFLRSGIGERYWVERIIDLQEVWALGDRQCTVSLDRVCRHLGITGKTGSGKDFAKLLETNPDAAREYLIGDLTRPQKVAQRMGVIP